MRNENRVRNLNIFTHSNLTYLFVVLSLFMVTIGATVLHYSVDKERLQLLDLLGADSPFKKRHLAAKCFFILLTAFVLSSITILFVWRFVGAWIYSSFGIVSDRSFPSVRPFPPETFSLMMLLYGLVVAMMTMYFTQVMRTVHKGKSNKAEKRGAAKVKKNAGKIVNWWRIEFQKRIDVFAENGRTSILVSANTVNHYANRFDSSVDEKYSYHNVSAKIGGVLKGRMAWFDLFGLHLKPYTIVTNIEGWKS